MFFSKPENSKKTRKVNTSNLEATIYLWIWRNVLCQFWQATIARTIVNPPKICQYTKHCKTRLIPRYQMQDKKKPSLPNNRELLSRPGRKWSKSYCSKICRGVHKTSTSLEHWISIFVETKSEIASAHRLSRKQFCHESTTRQNAVSLSKNLNILKRPWRNWLHQIHQISRRPLATINLQNCSSVKTILITLVPQVGVFFCCIT